MKTIEKVCTTPHARQYIGAKSNCAAFSTPANAASKTIALSMNKMMW